jgi:hypothetical protein
MKDKNNNWQDENYETYFFCEQEWLSIKQQIKLALNDSIPQSQSYYSGLKAKIMNSIKNDKVITSKLKFNEETKQNNELKK